MPSAISSGFSSVFRRHHRLDAAAHGEVADDGHAARLQERHEIVENLIGDMLVEDAAVPEFDHVELYEGLAEEVIPHLKVKPDIVLLDPPRAGLDKQVVDGILKLRPQAIAYVSCDPSTLARDSKRLIEGGYKLKQVTPFDLFPQTYHIESISIFER